MEIKVTFDTSYDNQKVRKESRDMYIKIYKKQDIYKLYKDISRIPF